MIKAAVLLTLALGLGACASQIGYYSGKQQAANDQLGQAVAQNIAAQTVNPQGSTEALVTDGARTTRALEAYRNDNVEHPSASTTMAMKANAGTEGN